MLSKKIYALAVILCLFIFFAAGYAVSAYAATAAEIEAGTDAALDEFRQTIKGGADLLQSAKGVLAFRRVYEAGFIVGGEYGEGALRIDGKTVDYYNLAAGSLGFQIGAQAKTIILLFREEQALSQFRASSGWKVGTDGSVALITVGAGETVDFTRLNDPIVAFVFDNKGLMFNISLEGAKFTKIER
jgi:lipid-binding SYLF domain-containing protein